MVKKLHISGYEEFSKLMTTPKDLESFSNIYLYFSGSQDTVTLKSWCSDCADSQPVVEEKLTQFDDNTLFVYIEIGDEVQWRERSNPFRKDPLTRLLVIPTLLKWNSPKRLEGEQCGKRELIDMMFESDSDEEI